MRISRVMRLNEELLKDSDYIKFEETYNKNEVIDKELLVKLLNKHLDLYNVFLKMNIFLYGFDTKELSKDLQDFLHYKGKKYYIDDLGVILRFYFKHHSMFIKSIKEIIDSKLRPQNEIDLLKRIINNPREEKIRPTFDYDYRNKSNEKVEVSKNE